MVTNYVKVIAKTYLAITCLPNDTILLSLSDTEWFYNAIKRQGLYAVENVESHLRMKVMIFFPKMMRGNNFNKIVCSNLSY